MGDKMNQSTEQRIYYFLGNITSHILHALPLYKELGGTFVVLSDKAKREIEKYNVPVITIDDVPRKWMRFGYKIKPTFHYLKIDRRAKKTVDFLNRNADVVIFYELYDFSESNRLTNPKTIFLTHGNMLKDYMNMSNRLTIFRQYDYMAALGPHLKKEFIEKDRINPKKLVELGIGRTDEIVKHKGRVVLSETLIKELNIDPNKKIFSYMPTFWGASSIYHTGKDIIRYFPDTYTLIFRPHPQTPKKILGEYLDNIKDKPHIIYAPEGKYKSLGLLDVYAASSAIIGDVSSVMLEAILTNKPLLFAYDTDQHKQKERDYEAIKEVVAYSQAITPLTKEDLPAVLYRALKNGVNGAIWEATQDQTFFHNDGTSIRAIAGFIRSLLRQRQ